MNIPEFEYETDTNSVYRIVEVALANGLNSEIKEDFEKYVEDDIERYLSYVLWEQSMGEDM